MHTLLYNIHILQGEPSGCYGSLSSFWMNPILRGVLWGHFKAITEYATMT